MAMKHGLFLCGVAGVLVAAGCTSAANAATCASEAGARVCVTQKSSPLQYQVQATGFQPNSDMQMSPAGLQAGSHPMQLRIGADGTYATHGGVLGMVGGRGAPSMMTLTFSGTVGSGTAVSIPVTMKG